MKDKIIKLISKEIGLVEEANDLGLNKEVENRLSYIENLINKYKFVISANILIKNGDDEEIINKKLKEIEDSLGGL